MISLFMSKAPGSSGALQASLGELQTSAGFNTRTEPAAEVDAIVRTQDVWKDNRNVSARVQVRDAAGNSKVSSTSASLRLSIEGQSDATGACSPNSNGICDAQVSVPISWFQEGSSLIALASVEVEGLEPTDPVEITLHGVPSFNATPSAGMVMELPLGPRRAGTTFSVPMTSFSKVSGVTSIAFRFSDLMK